MNLTDDQRKLFSPCHPVQKNEPSKQSQLAHNLLDMINNILSILRAGTPWRNPLERYSPRNTCHKSVLEWSQNGLSKKVLIILDEDLRNRDIIDFDKG
ncbi:transposase [Planctomycetota bacterium]|nr:transposase [Planctomycetota bacterium]